MALARAWGDPFDLAEALSQAGLHISLISDDPRGAELADEAVEVARARQRVRPGGHAAGSRHVQIPNRPRASDRCDRRIVRLRSARGAASTATARVIKAVAHLALRDDTSAADALLDALPVQQEVGEEYYTAMALSLAAVLPQTARTSNRRRSHPRVERATDATTAGSSARPRPRESRAPESAASSARSSRTCSPHSGPKGAR